MLYAVTDIYLAFDGVLYNNDNNYDDKKSNLSSIVEYPKYKSINIEHSAIEHSHTASWLEYA